MRKLNSETIGFIGVVLGAMLGIIPSFVTGYLQMQTEVRKAEIAGDIAASGELRREFRNAAGNILFLHDAIDEACWLIAHDGEMTALLKYRSNRQEVMASLVSAMAGIASLNRGLHDELHILVRKVYAIDAKIGSAYVGEDAPNSSAFKELSVACREMASNREGVPAQLAELWSKAVVPRATD